MTHTEAKLICERIDKTLDSLKSDLDWFVVCKEKDRKTFRRLVPGPKVGFVTSLLKVLYDEQNFKEWKFFQGLD
jgi:hypothetical protein